MKGLEDMVETNNLAKTLLYKAAPAANHLNKHIKQTQPRSAASALPHDRFQHTHAHGHELPGAHSGRMDGTPLVLDNGSGSVKAS